MDSPVATPIRRHTVPALERHKRVRRARNFFIIAVLAALVSVAGHCLPGDAPHSAAAPTASSANQSP
jgi:hypothetical protein